MIRVSQTVSYVYSKNYTRDEVIDRLVRRGWDRYALAGLSDERLGAELVDAANGDDVHGIYELLVDDAGDLDMDTADPGDWVAHVTNESPHGEPYIRVS